MAEITINQATIIQTGWQGDPDRFPGVFCPICNGRIFCFSGAQLDHETPLELGGRDEIENMRWVHTDPCHKVKTKLDNARIDKAKRQNQETGQQKRRAERKEREASGSRRPMWPQGRKLRGKSEWPQGRKIPSRPLRR